MAPFWLKCTLKAVSLISDRCSIHKAVFFNNICNDLKLQCYILSLSLPTLFVTKKYVYSEYTLFLVGQKILMVLKSLEPVYVEVFFHCIQRAQRGVTGTQ